MKRFFILAQITLVLPLISCSAFEFSKVDQFVKNKDCTGAESYVRDTLDNEGERYALLGGIASECRKNKQLAIDYFTQGAIKGNKDSVEALIMLGAKVPDPPKVIYREIPSQQPVQIQQPQQIIIQQPHRGSACTQDGGALSCPNHPNTKFEPVYR